MENKYLIVDTSILPGYYELVIKARDMVETGKAKDVTEATKAVGISRSTYYKYKDFVFAPNSDTMGKKAVIAFNLAHKKGVLSEVLRLISDMGANILTITQNLPIGGKAHVVLSVDTVKINGDINDIILAVSKINGASGVKLIAVE